MDYIGLVKEQFSNYAREENIIDIIKIEGDISKKVFYRILSEKKSYIVCFCQDNEKNRFYEAYNILWENKIKVPKIFDTRLNYNYFLQEDLGDIKLFDLKGDPKIIDYYNKSIEELIKIHEIDSKNYLGKYSTRASFDVRKLMEEVNLTIDYLYKDLIKNPSLGKELLLEFYKLCEFLQRQSMILTHRDFHSRNIMVNNEEIYIIDFQDMRMGVFQYDLVSILEDCYMNLDDIFIDDLKKKYWNNFSNIRKEQESYENFLLIYDYVALQRTFKAIGTFARVYLDRSDDNFKEFIKIGIKKISNICLKYPEFLVLYNGINKIKL